MDRLNVTIRDGVRTDIETVGSRTTTVTTQPCGCVTRSMYDSRPNVGGAGYSQSYCDRHRPHSVNQTVSSSLR